MLFVALNKELSNLNAGMHFLISVHNSFKTELYKNSVI
jgi:hypothetical protein